MSQRDLTNDFLANNTVAQQGRAADENPCVGSSILSRMNGNDNSRHVRVWFAKLFCLGSSVGRAGRGSSSLSAGAIIAALLNTDRNSAGVGQPLPQRKKEDRFPMIRF